MSFFSSPFVILLFLSKRSRHFKALLWIYSPVSIPKPCLGSTVRSAFRSPASDLQPGQHFEALLRICSPVSIPKPCLKYTARSVFSIPVSDMNPCQHSDFFLKKISRSAVRNFFAGKFVSGRGILQLPKGKKHIQQLKIPFTAQMQVRVLSASTKDAVVKQVNTAKNVLCIRPGSSIG